ncbi:hypothetical protein FISHEDRAFT_42413, partial [Fistulina hepatica ATCC 64428]
MSSPGRTRRTHVSDAITKLLKSLSLSDRIKKNYEIEKHNNANTAARLEFALHPVDGQQEPASETASFITLDEISDWPTLENDTLRSTLGIEHLPEYIMRTDNLERLVTNCGGPPAVKKSPNPDSKATLIYDLDALQKRFGNDNTITFPQWLDAIVNCASFESMRDKLGPDGPYAVQIATLHDFFSCLHNAEQMFQA